ncbi:flavin reductase family protein [Caldibacillus lycopersici]|uniref:Flavin reductase family protein n=1 Tax=Perspicuibacillus lycopersici TaxID=1325689 RepID=A0AAE3IT35_9BACI|nr:flavin reductase family protein [Perspicuibacillus lycopersici]MCU9612951.1 flavin reductase family protein [Perspicuibacillus lycopersici]
MISIDPTMQTERENYKLLIGGIIPRPIAFVTSMAVDGTINGAPFSYFSIVSSNPPMISVAVQRKNGKQKDTARNISATKEFVVHIVDEENVDKINETAASLLPEESELIRAKLTPTQSVKISVPGVEEAKMRLECILEQSMEIAGNTDLIIGKIVHFHVHEQIYSNGRIDPRGLSAVSRLAGNSYGKIGDIFDIERPK